MPKWHVKLDIAICDFKSADRAMRALIPREVIERRIFLIRGHRVMLDANLAELYQVGTFMLKRAVRRNIRRFPSDFMFQLTRGEANSLICQIGISKPSRRGGRRDLPFVFTEQGVAMLSTVLRSDRAVQVNIAIMRAFVRLREMISTNREFAARLELLEREVQNHGTRIESIFEAIKQLMAAPAPRRKSIGFRP